MEMFDWMITMVLFTILQRTNKLMRYRCGEDVKHAVLKKYPLTLAPARQFTRTVQATTLIKA